MSFDSLGLHPELLRAVTTMGITTPTPIQADAIPVALSGRDVLGSANTGSGKTAAFMLPTLHRLLSNPGQPNTTRVLVLSPTRELAVQITDHVRKLAGSSRITSAAIYGGVPMNPQVQAFRRGVNILVATPGRLLDHLRNNYAKLDHVEVLILDEADRMLDMGFLPDIRKILARVPANRQTLLFSATLAPEIRALSQEFMRDPVRIDKAVKGAAAAAAASITQAVYPVPHHLKSGLLIRLLASDALDSVIVFVRTKARADRLTRNLAAANISCAPIHGDRSQGQRQRALDGFKAGHTRVLVATDVAARGIDVADVSHVINFDCPPAPEDYVHRIGRTGRAAASGDAFTFVSPDEEQHLRLIQRSLNKTLPRIKLEDFDYTKAPPVQPNTGHGHRAPHNAHPAQQPSRLPHAAGRYEARGIKAGPAGGPLAAGRRRSAKPYSPKNAWHSSRTSKQTAH